MPNRRNFTILAKSLFALALLGNASGSLTQTQSGRSTHDISTQDKKRLERFEKQVDDLRARLKIPGLSAVVLKDQKVVWIKGFGFADLEDKIPTTPDTLFHLASITKTFASTLIMQLVEQGKLDLDEPMSHYSTDFKDDRFRICCSLRRRRTEVPDHKWKTNFAQRDVDQSADVYFNDQHIQRIGLLSGLAYGLFNHGLRIALHAALYCSVHCIGNVSSGQRGLPTPAPKTPSVLRFLKPQNHNLLGSQVDFNLFQSSLMIAHAFSLQQ